MSGREQIIIKDAYTLFDLIELGLLDALFSLNYALYTTTYVIAEVTAETEMSLIKEFMTNGELIVDGSSDIKTIQVLYENNKGMSLADCSILELAGRIHGLVLSADTIFQSKINNHKSIVISIVWIINELVASDALSKDDAIKKLNFFGRINPYSSKEEVLELINNYQV